MEPELCEADQQALKRATVMLADGIRPQRDNCRLVLLSPSGTPRETL